MNDDPPNLQKWLATLVQEKCGLSHVWPWQLDHALNLIASNVLFLVIAPGSSKTLVICAPLLAAQSHGCSEIALLVVPTKILTKQQVAVFIAFRIRALAINEDSIRNAYYEGRDLFNELCEGNDICVAIIMPWMLQSEHISKIIMGKKTRGLVRWFFVDESHLVNDGDDSVWRVAYHVIIHMRARLPSRVVWAALTGTFTPAKTRKITAGLGFRNGLFINAHHTVDHPNIKFIPHFLEHAVSGSEFLDLSFVIPFSMKSAEEISPTLIFCDTIELGWRVMAFLD
ncbi:hypothetical protein BKA93DRAFT_735885 [Sparassis latifolia]